MKEIYFYNEDVDYPDFFLESEVLSWLDLIAEAYHVTLNEISFIFCTDDYILNINNTYLGHDYFTDVITFDYSEKSALSGDVFISLDTVRSNAELYKTDFKDEFFRVICHSILHLIGFKDKTEDEAKEMRENENNCLKWLKTIRK